jgi:hypothetical protein
MRRAGALRRLTLSVVVAATAAVGLGGCVLAPFPEPVAAYPGVIVAPRPVIIAPRGYGYYRGGHHRGYHRGYGHRWN